MAVAITASLISSSDLKQKLLNPKCVNRLAEKLIEYYEKSKVEDKKDIKAFEKKLVCIQKKLDNIVSAIADGLYNPCMKATIDTLEKEKADVTIMIGEAQSKLHATSLDKAMIVAYLEKGHRSTWK